MELCYDDKVMDNPSADDVRRAIDGAPTVDDKELILDADDGSHVEATAQPDGTFKVGGCDGQHDLEIKKPLGAAEVKAIFLKYLERDASWREGYPWHSIEVGHTAPPARSGPPPWALGIVIGSIVFVVIAFMVLQGSNNSWRAALPFGDSDYFWIGLIALPVVVLLVVAVLSKLLEARQASTWSTASGRIVTSETRTEHRRSAGEATTVITLPLVEYEFSVGGQTWRGNRISIGEDTGGANTEATLQRYPIGAVVSVYYDPGNPKKSVLERDIPKGFAKGLLAILVFLAVVAGIIYWLATAAPALLAKYLPNAEAPVTIFAACFGVLVLLFFIASWRRSRQAANWPVVRGTVLSSGWEKVSDTSSSGRKQTSYAPTVEYRYRVNNVDYASRQIKLGMTLSGSQAYAEKVAGRYPKSGTVDVHYDPANPSMAALENPTGFNWLLLAVALACFGLAAYTAGLFK